MIMEDAMTDHSRRAATRTSRRTARVADAVPPAPVPDAAPPAALPPALPPSATVGVSPKTTWTTVAAGVLGLVVAALNGLQQNPALIGFLPPWAQWGVLTLAPMLFVALAGYWAPAGDIYVPGDLGPTESATPVGRAGAEQLAAEWLERYTADPHPRVLDEPTTVEPLAPSDEWDDFYDGEPDEYDDGFGTGATTVDDQLPDHVDSATEPGGIRSADWPYEGGSHESGYPRNP